MHSNINFPLRFRMGLPVIHWFKNRTRVYFCSHIPKTARKGGKIHPRTPFIHQIAKFDVIEFVPTKYAEGFDRYINI